MRGANCIRILLLQKKNIETGSYIKKKRKLKREKRKKKVGFRDNEYEKERKTFIRILMILVFVLKSCKERNTIH